jgi:hypothetical protein
MADVVNLNAVKKQRQRAAAAQHAAENRARYGRTKTEKANQAREAERRAAILEGARREPTLDAPLGELEQPES